MRSASPMPGPPRPAPPPEYRGEKYAATSEGTPVLLFFPPSIEFSPSLEKMMPRNQPCFLTHRAKYKGSRALAVSWKKLVVILYLFISLRQHRVVHCFSSSNFLFFSFSARPQPTDVYDHQLRRRGPQGAWCGSPKGERDRVRGPLVRERTQ